MITSIMVQKEGLYTSIQDTGRYGYQREGVSISGGMDTYAMQMANILVGNSRGTACLEITIIGPQLKFNGAHLVAICGAVFDMKLNGKEERPWRTLAVEDGGVLKIGHVQQGCRAYIAVRGGLDIPPVLNSRSTDVRVGIGGLDGRTLQSGDVIPTPSPPDLCRNGASGSKTGTKQTALNRGSMGRIGSRSFHPSLIFCPDQHIEARVILGPQENAFTDRGLETFLNTTYRVTPASDRMGYRLEGAAINHRDKADILSDATAFGTIQVPQNGQPIVLMADRQPTGGYTKIATVISVDIPKVAQLLPGQTISFRKVTLEEAHAARLQTEKQLSLLEKLTV